MSKTFLCNLLLFTACTVVDEDAVGHMGQEVSSANGISLNGISLNGISLNGISLNGISLNGISLNGTSLSGTTITAVSSIAPPLTGTSVVGSTWTGTATDGTTLKLRVEAAAQGAAPNRDLWFYKVSYQTATGWNPLCGLDALNQPILAVTTAGTWTAVSGDSARYGASSTQFTFACRGKTVAKCIDLGYKTYRGYTAQLATCVRMLRGDYCGTGNAYTVDGTLLNLYDNVGVQLDSESWPPEAEWTPSGARCVNSQNSARFQLAVSRDPKCVKAIEISDCGYNFDAGAILIDELPQNSQTQTQTQTQMQTKAKT